MNLGSEKRAEAVPAIVLGGGVNGLGVARSLGAAGVPVFLAEADAARAELRTRHAQPILVADLCSRSLIEDLMQLGEARFAGRRPVLLLTQEQTVRAVGTAQEALRTWYRFVLPEHQLLDALMHKESFNRLAQQNSLRVPRTVHVRAAVDVDTALALTYPLIIKPARHEPEYGRRFQKAYRVGDADEARALLGCILDVLPDVVVQEWVPGTDADIYFCLQHLSSIGAPEASFVGRKIRSWPPNVGGTASCTAAPEALELAETTARFFARVGMSGLASMEYKRHAVTGEFVAIEPTVGRTDYQEEVATLNGVNLPYAYYRSILGLDRLGVNGSKTPVIWRDRQADRQSLAHAEQTVHGWPEGHDVIRDALWRLDDPGPWLASQWARSVRKGRRLVSGLTVEQKAEL